MRKYKVLLILVVAAGLTVFLSAKKLFFGVVFQDDHTSNIRVEETKRSLAFPPEHRPSWYKEGKSVVYRDLTNCSQPNLLENEVNPCWKRNITGALVCSARILLLGFHKSGTSDLTMRFSQHSGAHAMTGDYFLSGDSLSPQCPMQWIEQYPRRQKVWKKKRRTKIGYNDCPGCVLVSNVLQENATFIVRQSAIQYLQYTMMENSRYIITMRNPVDRMISHFFYVHKIQRADNPYANYSLEEVGNAFFHGIVSQSISSLISCLDKHGTTVCVLESRLAPLKKHDGYLRNMIVIGCYSTHLKEAFKFIPKEKIYFSKLEDYSKDEAESMKQIYTFVGLPVFEQTHKKKKAVRNAGYDSKPVLVETRELLRSFYEPFNLELANLLDDDKWLWS